MMVHNLTSHTHNSLVRVSEICFSYAAVAIMTTTNQQARQCPLSELQILRQVVSLQRCSSESSSVHPADSFAPHPYHPSVPLFLRVVHIHRKGCHKPDRRCYLHEHLVRGEWLDYNWLRHHGVMDRLHVDVHAAHRPFQHRQRLR